MFLNLTWLNCQSYACSRATCMGASFDSLSQVRRRLINDDASADDEEVSFECWRFSANESDVCKSNALQCTQGAIGPLCGSCDTGFYYSSTELVCLPCNSIKRKTLIQMMAYLFIGVMVGPLYCGSRHVPKGAQHMWIFGVFQRLDSGTIRVVWSNYQVFIFAHPN